MKKILLIVLFAASFIISNSSFAQTKDAMYFGLNYGSRVINNSDLNQFSFFNNSSPSQSSQGSNYLTDLEIGYQFSNPLGAELGLEIGPPGSVNIYGLNGGGAAGSISSTVNVYTLYVMPTYRIPIQDSIFAGVLVNTFGVRLGKAILQDNFNASVASGQNVIFNGYSEAFDLGAAYRMEQFFTDNFSLGYEVAYDFAKFNGSNSNLTSSNGSYNYNGSLPTVDLSGFSIKVALNYWFDLPFKSGILPAKNEKTAETAVTSTPNTNSNLNLSEQNIELGNKMLEAKQCALAVDYFKVSLSYDATNPEAWLGLGNAYYCRGNKKEATRAFNKALELDPSNVELKNLLTEY